MAEVLGTDEFEAWFLALPDRDVEAVIRVVGLLERKGVALGHPYSTDIRGSKAIRELRILSRGRKLRVFYAFDPARQVVLLIGGDKTGDKQFYDRYVRKAERIWTGYLASMKQRKDGP